MGSCIADGLDARTLVDVFKQQPEICDFVFLPIISDTTLSVDVLSEQRHFLDPLVRQPRDFR